MNTFRRRLQWLRWRLQHDRHAARQAAEFNALLVAHQARTQEARLEALRARRMATLESILGGLGGWDALTALREEGAAPGFTGPRLIRQPQQGQIKVVLVRKWHTWFPRRTFERQVGVRVFDTGTVFVEVAEFRRVGRGWRITPLHPATPYTPEDRDAIKAAVESALLAWAQHQLAKRQASG